MTEHERNAHDRTASGASGNDAEEPSAPPPTAAGRTVRRAIFLTDGLPGADAALWRADRLFGPEVDWVVSAIVPPPAAIASGATGFAAPILTEPQMRRLDAADQRVGDDAAAAAAGALDDPVERVVLHGGGAGRLDALVADVDADVIVVPAPAAGDGESRIRPADDVLDELLASAPVPVLVTPRERVVDAGDARSPGRRVLIAVDDTPLDCVVLRAAVDLFGGGDDGVRPVVVHVDSGRAAVTAAPIVTALPVRDELVDDVLGALADAAVHARQVAEGVIDDTGMRGAAAVGEVGDPSTGIVRVAGEVGASAIAVGTHGRGWWSRLFDPSVGTAVATRSPLPVLVVRPGVDGA